MASARFDSFRWQSLGGVILGSLAIWAWPSLALAGAEEYETETIPTVVRPIQWTPFRQNGSPIHGHTFSLSVQSGYCVGEPKPEFDHIRVVERRKTKAHPYKSAVITVFVKYPEHTRVVPPSDSEHHTGCFGVGWGLARSVTLKRSPTTLFVFDGSHSPPRRAWSPPRR